MDYITYFWSFFLTNLPNMVGFVMPLFIQVLNRDIQTERDRYIVSVMACVLVAFLLHFNKLAYGSPVQFIAFAGLIFGESNLLYTLYFSKSGIRSDLIRLLGDRELKEPLEKVSPSSLTNQPEG